MTVNTPAEPKPGGAPRRAESRHPDLDSLYCINADGSRNTIHTADVRGRYQRRKWLLWSVLIVVYLSLPWVHIDGRPAVLIDIARRHFYLFGHTFNAQDFWLAFFVLSGIGFSLIVISALWGRIWCGYACPQTVFLEGVFRRIERLFEGNATHRKKLAASGMTAEKVLRRGGKYLTYFAVAFVLSHTFLGYFMPAREVLAAITSSPASHPTAFTFIVVFTLIIYLNFAWFREQLCIVVCPYGRLQGVLYDRDTTNVGYDRARGEPRGRHGTQERGDCIDCFRCVAVCPTGIDIRNGTQLECVGCANCIDACDEVMDKLGQPRGLVRYDSLRVFEEGGTRRFWRPRVFFYAVMMLVGIAVFAFAASRRTGFEANVVRQGTPYTLEGDVVTNAFLVHVVNKQPDALTYTLEPVPDADIEWILAMKKVELPSLGDQRVPVFVKVKRGAMGRKPVARLIVSSPLERRDLEVPVLGPALQ